MQAVRELIASIFDADLGVSVRNVAAVDIGGSGHDFRTLKIVGDFLFSSGPRLEPVQLLCNPTAALKPRDL